MVEAARPSPIPDAQGSDTGAQSALANTRLAKINSQERAAYLAQKLQQQQSFYQAAKLEGADQIRSLEERQNPMLRRNDILERVLVGGENPAAIAASYGKDETWALSEFKVGLIRLWRKSSSQLKEQFPEEAIIPDRSDTRKQKTQKKEDDLVRQLKREDIGSKEEVEAMIGRVSYRFYAKHKDLFRKLDELMIEQGIQSEGGYSSRVMQIVSELLGKEGVVVKEMKPDKNRGGKPVHIIWFQDYDEVKDLVNERIKTIVEAIIS